MQERNTGDLFCNRHISTVTAYNVQIKYDSDQFLMASYVTSYSAFTGYTEQAANLMVSSCISYQ